MAGQRAFEASNEGPNPSPAAMKKFKDIFEESGILLLICYVSGCLLLGIFI